MDSLTSLTASSDRTARGDRRERYYRGAPQAGVVGEPGGPGSFVDRGHLAPARAGRQGQGSPGRRTDKEIDAGEYGAPPPGFDYLVTGHEGFGIVTEVGENVTEVKPGDYVVSIVRQAGDSIYDYVGTPDFTTDDSYHEHGINLVHGFLTEAYVEDAGRLVLVPKDCARSASCWSRPPWSRRGSPRRMRSSAGSRCGSRNGLRSSAPAPSASWPPWSCGCGASTSPSSGATSRRS